MKSEIIIPGRPITKKNHQTIFPLCIKIDRESKRRCPSCGIPLTIPFNVAQSAPYRLYEETCLWQLKSYHGPKFTGKITLTCIYWMPNRRSKPDLVGLIQSTQDILQKSGIIRDDQDIVSLDGSRIAGIDKAIPRVEIYIEDFEG